MITVDDLTLEYVYELRTKIKHLMNPELLNCPVYAYHGLKREELINTLMLLNNDGYINFSINDDIIKKEFLNVSELIEMPFIDSWYVGLTGQGGIRWEKLFKPIWKNYISLEYNLLTSKLYQVTIESASKEAIENQANR